MLLYIYSDYCSIIFCVSPNEINRMGFVPQPILRLLRIMDIVSDPFSHPYSHP